MSNITLVIIPVCLVSHHPPWCYIFVVVVVILLSVDIFLFFILCRVNRFTLYFLCWEGYVLRSKGKKKNNTHKNTGSPSAPRDPLHSCFSHQRLPDKWVHQGEHWDVVSRMGHVARARGGDTFSRLRISMHARVRARACAIWLCANVSFCLFMGCDNVDGCQCHLWLPPQQMGSGSDRRRKVSEISPLDRRRGGWEACALHKAHNLPRQDTGGGVHCTHFQFEFQHWLVGGSNFQLLRRMIKMPQCAAWR